MMDVEKKEIINSHCYLYIHYTEDWTKPFYVGIGKRYRCFDFNARNKYWKNYVKKHGNPKVKIISYYDDYEKSKIAEKALIGFFGRNISNNGMLVNITLGGDGTCGRIGNLHPMYGKRHTQETRSKISQKIKGKFSGSKNPMYGKHGELNNFYGKHHTEEQKKYQSELRKKMYKGANNPFYGKKHSESTKNKLSAFRTGKSMSEDVKVRITETLKKKRQETPELWDTIKPWDFSRSIILLDTTTGVFYYSYKDAAKYYPYDRKTLRKVVKENLVNINLKEV